MPFIQFPFIEVPKELHELVGEPTPGTRAYRREGTFKECGEWLEKLGEYYKGDVGLSTSSVVLFVPVSRASVYKRIKEGKLTAFFFYVTHEETRLFGAKRRAKERPFIVVSVSECKAWAEEIKRRVGFVDDPDEVCLRKVNASCKRAVGMSQRSKKPRKPWNLPNATRRIRATGR